jgi:hypothetical protein
MRNMSEKIKTHILSSIHFLPQKMPFKERMWKNMVEPERPHRT